MAFPRTPTLANLLCLTTLLIASFSAAPSQAQTNPQQTHIAQGQIAVTVQDLQGFNGIIRALNITPNGQSLLVGTGDNQIVRVNLAQQDIVYNRGSQINDFADLAVDNNGNLMAIAARNEVVLRRVADGSVVRSLRGHTNRVSGVAFSPDGKTLVSVSGGDRTIRVWDVSSGSLLTTIAQGIGPTTSVVFTPDGQSFITGAIGDDRTIRVWNAENFANTFTSPQQPGFVNGLAITPDGTKVVAAVRNFVKAWDLATGKELFSVQGPRLEINTIAVSPNGRYVATANKEGTIMIFDLNNGQLVTTLSGHRGWVLSLAFSPDGNTLFSGAEDKLVKVWSLDGL